MLAESDCVNTKTVPHEVASIVAIETGRNARTAKMCMLILTHNCNLRCIYCYEKFKTSRKMTFRTALRCLNEQLDFVRESSKYTWLSVDLFGGEPLLNFDVIRLLVQWVRDNVKDVNVHFTISSNGTLLTDEIKVWLLANRDIVFYGVSYDGSKESQLRNRGMRNESAVDFSRKTWPSQAFRMTIPPDSIVNLSETILTALRQGFRIRAELAGGIYWPRECASLFLEECRKLKNAFLADQNLPITLLDRFFKGGEDADISGVVACGSGTRCTCYDVDGRTYACQMFTPLTVGEKSMPLSEVDLTQESAREDPTCVGCPIRHWCPTCYGMNYAIRGHTSLRDHGMCHMYLTQALVTAELQQQIRIREPLTRESAAILKFLLRICKKIERKLATI